MRLIKILFILAALGACYFVLKRFITKSHSPSSIAHHEKNGLEITLEYCRPYKQKREIQEKQPGMQNNHYQVAILNTLLGEVSGDYMPNIPQRRKKKNKPEHLQGLGL